MNATTTTRATRLANVRPGEVILIDRGGHRALVLRNERAADGRYATTFLMEDGREGGWDGRAGSEVEVVVAPAGGAA